MTPEHVPILCAGGFLLLWGSYFLISLFNSCSVSVFVLKAVRVAFLDCICDFSNRINSDAVFDP